MVIFNSYVSLPEGKPLAMVFTEVFAQLRKTKNEMKGHPAIGHGTPDVLPHKGRIKMVKTHTHTKKTGGTLYCLEMGLEDLGRSFYSRGVKTCVYLWYLRLDFKRVP